MNVQTQFEPVALSKHRRVIAHIRPPQSFDCYHRNTVWHMQSVVLTYCHARLFTILRCWSNERFCQVGERQTRASLIPTTSESTNTGTRYLTDGLRTSCSEKYSEICEKKKTGPERKRVELEIGTGGKLSEKSERGESQTVEISAGLSVDAVRDPEIDFISLHTNLSTRPSPGARLSENQTHHYSLYWAKSEGIN